LAKTKETETELSAHLNIVQDKISQKVENYGTAVAQLEAQNKEWGDILRKEKADHLKDQQSNMQLASELEESKKDIDNLKKDAITLNTKLNKAEKDLKDKEAKIRNIQETLKKKSIECDGTKKENDILSKDLNNLKYSSELSTKQKDIEISRLTASLHSRFKTICIGVGIILILLVMVVIM